MLLECYPCICLILWWLMNYLKLHNIIYWNLWLTVDDHAMEWSVMQRTITTKSFLFFVFFLSLFQNTLTDDLQSNSWKFSPKWVITYIYILYIYNIVYKVIIKTSIFQWYSITNFTNIIIISSSYMKWSRLAYWSITFIINVNYL